MESMKEAGTSTGELDAVLMAGTGADLRCLAEQNGGCYRRIIPEPCLNDHEQQRNRLVVPNSLFLGFSPGWLKEATYVIS